MTTPPDPDPYAAPPAGQVPDAPQDGGPGPASPAGPPVYPAYPTYAAGPPGYPPTPPAGGAAPGPWAGSGTEANSLAVWSLALAILGWLCFGLLTTVPAIVVGARAKRAAAEGRANNAGLATAGVVLGWIGTVLNVLVLIAVVVLVASVGWDGVVDWLEENSTTAP